MDQFGLMPKWLMTSIGGNTFRKGAQKEPFKRKWLYFETMTYEKWDRGLFVTIGCGTKLAAKSIFWVNGSPNHSNTINYHA